METSNIIKDLEPMLRGLAEKLGTTSEYLWTVMVKQAYISGIMHVGTVIAFAIILPLWIKFARHAYSLTILEKYEDRWDGDIMIPIYILSGVFCIASIVVFIASPAAAITCFFNPEYWALREILSSIGSQ